MPIKIIQYTSLPIKTKFMERVAMYRKITKFQSELEQQSYFSESCMHSECSIFLHIYNHNLFLSNLI
jgi:hypothetical protein